MISEFFKGREIFITGGSGILGKALIEKLLRSCNIGKIYILLRPKNRTPLQERLKTLKQDKIFRRLNSEKPNEFDDKICPIPGDVELPMLGITPEYMKLLANVSVVFHGAATVRFDEPLLQAVKLNVGGTLEALRFGETLKHLEVFMHVSTFFSNPYLEFTEAKLYEPPMDWKFLLNLANRDDISEEIMEALTRKLIIGFPNTYCFTKNIAESLVNDFRDKLPLVIYRPAILIMSAEEPEPGFPTNLTGAVGMFVLTGTGLLKVMNSPKEVFIDFTPQDLAIKSMAFFAMKTAQIYAQDCRPTEIPIFHTSMYTHIDVTYAGYVDLLLENGIFRDAAYNKNLLLPGIKFTTNNLIFYFLFILKHLLPALLVDLLLVLFGRKPVMMKAQRKTFIMMQVLLPFTWNTYKSNGICCAEEMMQKLHG
ncbi:fatty acyl-CoA reductase 1-like [Stomoxys calcitrans]|uniref:fatty acyl-CoA reductase 1-like n=1 Tax=Stomoxys calcitrans TaxID=35570 RepID=UPI0027E3178E|nr:fatty acyl-CoA reductase 1-like [Stomoxys calcitrans]